MTAKGDADSTDPLTIKTQPFVIARRDLTFPHDRPSDLDLRSKVGTLRQGMTLPASVGPRAEPATDIDTCRGDHPTPGNPEALPRGDCAGIPVRADA